MDPLISQPSKLLFEGKKLKTLLDLRYFYLLQKQAFCLTFFKKYLQENLNKNKNSYAQLAKKTSDLTAILERYSMLENTINKQYNIIL